MKKYKIRRYEIEIERRKCPYCKKNFLIKKELNELGVSDSKDIFLEIKKLKKKKI